MQRFNRFTNKITRSSSPKGKAQLENEEGHSLKVRVPGNPNAKIIPLPLHPGGITTLHDSSKENSISNVAMDSKELKNNAFEVVIDNNAQNTHPMDEPLTLRNGKKIYPNDNTNTSNEKINATDEIIGIIHNILKFSVNLLVTFWNMDLHCNISLSEGSNHKIHIPTTILSLVSIKLVFLLLGLLSQPEIISRSNSSSGIGFFPIAIIIVLCAYWFSHAVTTSTPTADSPVSTPITPVCNLFHEDANTIISSETANSEQSIWSNKESVNSGYESEITPPITRKNSFQSKLETRVYMQKPPVEKVKIVHRREEKQKTKKLEINLPVELKSQRQVSFEEISKQRRNEMLNAFH